MSDQNIRLRKVKGMLATEYNEEEVMEKFKEDGRKEGRKEEANNNIKALMETLGFTIDQAMDALKIPLNERSKYKVT